MKWAAGMLAAPRPDETHERTGLEACLESQIQAGWNPWIFAEPGTRLPNSERVIQRPGRVSETLKADPSPEGRFGNVGNWIQAAADLLAISSDAEAYVLFEDDAFVASGSRDALESLLWPSSEPCAVSLYAASRDAFRIHTPSMVRHKNDRFWGSLGLVMSPEAIQILINSESYRTFTRFGWPSNMQLWQKKGVDSWIGEELWKHKVPMFTFSPSLIRHYTPHGISNNSSLNNPPPVKTRKEVRFIENDGRYIRMIRSGVPPAQALIRLFRGNLK